MRRAGAGTGTTGMGGGGRRLVDGVGGVRGAAGGGGNRAREAKGGSGQPERRRRRVIIKGAAAAGEVDGRGGVAPRQIAGATCPARRGEKTVPLPSLLRACLPLLAGH